MKNFLLKNNLYILTALGIVIVAYTALKWGTMPVMQRTVGLFAFGLVLHLWEEGRFPGGFTEMITQKIKFTQVNPHFGEVVTGVLVLLVAFVPFFVGEPFLLLAAMLLGVLEAVVHTVIIWLFDLKRPYSPGLVTAVFVLLPISTYGIWYAVAHDLLSPMSWGIAIVWMLGGLAVAQRVVVTTSGMTYSEFLRNVCAAFSGKQSSVRAPGRRDVTSTKYVSPGGAERGNRGPCVTYA